MTAVIGTASGAAPEIVYDGLTGFLAPVSELAGLLSRATELDRAACRAAAEQRFSATTMVASHIALYQQLLTSQEQRRLSLAGRVPAAGPSPVVESSARDRGRVHGRERPVRNEIPGTGAMNPSASTTDHHVPDTGGLSSDDFWV
ncbi:hypothetical protein J2790_001817 [Paenarthrobacter nicotinovorans]|uniref:hypothetical protein n=1 Tax=Micrococcaceae TaxID=1268 RepID=UPI000876D602|nr:MULTISPECIES: hypothetical protein [Micrococcaceae]MDR6436696.1 hypothetical protein [Paenarthrobacter nicotinovorans]SCZ56880.1 hypothetical protein SAMN02799638_01996 [Arthrobacter sp. UNCCL28]